MMERSKKAVLLGATGLVGKQLLSILLESKDYDEVTVLTRRPLPAHPKLQKVELADFDAMPSCSEVFHNASDIFCCLGTTIKTAGSREIFRKVDYDYPLLAAQLAKKAGAQRFIIITAMGADPASKVFYNRVKGEIETSIRTLGLPSVSIIRPSLLLGDRSQFRMGERAASLLIKPLMFIFTGKLYKYKPIKDRDVAAVMHRIAQMYIPGTSVYENDQLHRMANSA